MLNTCSRTTSNVHHIVQMLAPGTNFVAKSKVDRDRGTVNCGKREYQVLEIGEHSGVIPQVTGKGLKRDEV